jgi:site-specific DNA recombinase
LDKIYSDAGISGFKMKNRPGIQEALNTVRKGDILVVFSLSRFSRSVIEGLTELDCLSKRGVDFVSLTENIDTTSAMGKAFSGVIAIFNQLYRDQISEHTRMALAHKRSKREKTGGDVPLGYDVEEGILVDNPGEQEVLCLIQELNGRGLSLRKICKALENAGHKTKRGRVNWHPQIVSQILRRAA